MSLSRRDVLRTAALGASGAVLTGCGGGESGSSLSGGETAGSRGTIAVSYPAESTGTFRGLLERFTAETDIGVRWLIQQGDYKRFQQQMTVQFGSRDSSFDVVFCDDYCTTQFAAAGFLSELEPVADAQGIDIDDWPKATIEDTSRWRGKLYRLPANCEIFLFVYRTDAFAKAGVEPPATWDQLIDVGRKIMESGASEYGIGLQGRANGVLSNDIQAWGGQAGASILDLDTPESKESLAFYKGLFTTEKVAQPGAPGRPHVGRRRPADRRPPLLLGDRGPPPRPPLMAAAGSSAPRASSFSCQFGGLRR